MNDTKLVIVVPCYNEEQVLPITAKLFLNKLHSLERDWKISTSSRVLFVDEGHIKEEASPAEFFGNPKDVRLKEFLSKVL